MPCGTQVITTEPLSDEVAASLLPQDYCVEDCNFLLDYFRLSADRRLIYGGGVIYGARDPAQLQAIWRGLDAAEQAMPELARSPM